MEQKNNSVTSAETNDDSSNVDDVTTSAPIMPNLMLGDVFSMFVSKDYLRPAMCKPFVQNGKVYATDATMVIFIDEKDCDFEVKNEYQEKAPNVEAIVPIPNTSKIIYVQQSDFDKFKTEDELEYTGEEINCETCNGEGVVEWEFEHYTKDFDCPKCDGTGYKEEKQQRKTGNKIFGVCRVKVGETYFDMKRFYKLIQVQKVIGGDIELIYSEKPNTIHSFKIGKCTILIMPCPIDDENDCDGVLNIA